ncbi:penicillin-binding protein, partial [Streptomyces sp. A7024]
MSQSETPEPDTTPEPAQEAAGPGALHIGVPSGEADAEQGPETPDTPEPAEPAAPKAPSRRRRRRLLPSWHTVTGSALLFVALCSGAFAVGYMAVDMPEPNHAAVAQSNLFTYSDGTVLASDGEIDRESVGIERIPEPVRDAVLAAEDRNFYTDSAVNPAAMVRAGYRTMTGKGKQSGSTITQQYVKNYYLDQTQTVSRKVKEFFISIKLDREATKDEILEGYLNTSYFGRNAYGIQAAAKAYYNKDAQALNVAEGAYLAALLNAPNYFDVTANPQNRAAAEARWNYVLDGMITQGWLTPKQRARLTFPEPLQAKPREGLSGQRGYLVEAVKSYLTENRILDEKTLAAGGFRIRTTIQKPKQEAFVQAVQDELMGQLDDSRQADKYLRAGGASIDVKSGKVVALYGGRDYTQQFVNNATRRDYQVGSAFKPFVFTAAVQNHAKTGRGHTISPRTVYDGDSKRQVMDHKNKRVGYAPQNQDNDDYGRISVAEATNSSVNAVYAQMAQDVGPEKVRQTAVKLGLPDGTPELQAHPSIALGSATASVLDMTQAYATLANHGKRGTYAMVEGLTKNGEAYPLPPNKEHRVVSRKAADATTAVLKSVVEEGSGDEAQNAGREAAGKTGTGEHNRSAWFAGYTPELATVVAMMGQDSESGMQKSMHGALGEKRIGGGKYPARIWAAYTASALEDEPERYFNLKAGSAGRLPAPPPPPTVDARPPAPAPVPGPGAGRPPW